VRGEVEAAAHRLKCGQKCPSLHVGRRWLVSTAPRQNHWKRGVLPTMPPLSSRPASTSGADGKRTNAGEPRSTPRPPAIVGAFDTSCRRGPTAAHRKCGVLGQRDAERALRDAIGSVHDGTPGRAARTPATGTRRATGGRGPWCHTQTDHYGTTRVGLVFVWPDWTLINPNSSRGSRALVERLLAFAQVSGVRAGGLEPPQPVGPLGPKPSASASSATLA
jgi:hypothetical protein